MKTFENISKSNIVTLQDRGGSLMSPRAIFESGQMHRWEKFSDGSYVVQAADKVCRVLPTRQSGSKVEDQTRMVKLEMTDVEHAAFWADYFDLQTDYTQIFQALEGHACLKDALQFGAGMRLLNQDPFETIIAFIISSNNNITRIRKSMEALSQHLGASLGVHFGRKRYAFPSAESIASSSPAFLREACGLGYRDVSVHEAAKKIATGHVQIQALQSFGSEDLDRALQSFRGIGQKVSDCIILFGFRKWNSFPVDVWTRRALDQIVFPGNQSNNDALRMRAEDLFGEYSGIAQQLLFYYVREHKLRS